VFSGLDVLYIQIVVARNLKYIPYHLQSAIVSRAISYNVVLSGKGKRVKKPMFPVITPKIIFINSLLRRRVRFCGHITRYSLLLKEPNIFLAVRLNFMFKIIISAIFLHDNGNISDTSLWSLKDVSSSAYAVMPTVTSRAVRNCNVCTDSVMSVSQISKRRLTIPCFDQDKARTVCDYNDPLSVCHTVLWYFVNGCNVPWKWQRPSDEDFEAGTVAREAPRKP
jgi:hypothetical protein